MAVQELYPGTQVTIGPAIEDGFYYDFARDDPVHAGRPAQDRREDARDHQGAICRPAAKCGRATRRSRISRASARHYKAELIAEHPGRTRTSRSIGMATGTTSAAARISTPPPKIGDAFKLTKIAGAYWRGDAKNAQLQRIYGTAWRDKKELDAYLLRLEEAGEARPSQARQASWSSSPSRPMSARACRCGCPTAW